MGAAGTRRSYLLTGWGDLASAEPGNGGDADGAWAAVALHGIRGSEATRLSAFARAVRGEGRTNLADFATALRVQSVVEGVLSSGL